MNTEDLLKSEVSQLDVIYAACRAIDLANLKIPSKEMGFLFVAMHRLRHLLLMPALLRHRRVYIHGLRLGYRFVTR